MDSPTKSVLYFGDQTDSFVDGIDQLFRQAATTPWLQNFLDDLARVFKEESMGMDPVLQKSMGEYFSLLELADQYRHTADEVGMARAVLLHAVRGSMLLQWVMREPKLLDATAMQPERMGISGGLTNLVALAVSNDFDSLYTAILEAARIFVRLCRFTSVRSRAMEDRPGHWGCAIVGITPDELRKVLEKYQQSMGIPAIKRAKVGVTGDRWSTIIAPPSVLELVIHQCPALKHLPKNDLSIHALQHVVTVSGADLDYIVGSSAMLELPVNPDFRVWGMDNPHASYANWGEMIRAVVHQVLSLPLDITVVMAQLNSWLGSRKLDVKVIGPSSHTPYFAGLLKTGGSTTTFYSDRSLEKPSLPRSGRIAIVGMAGKGPGSNSAEDLWNLIMSKQDLCEEIPKDRFNLDDFYATEHDDKCTTKSRFGCFMERPGNFDARFFKVSPREAILMDPGHRQFLMSTYEALEMAGYSDGPTRATDPNRIAAFYGQSNDDWHMISHYTLGCDAYTLQGAQRAFGAGRAAFQFKWEGPTYSLDSACASSSSALHLACLSLLTKDIDMAVVGAANIVGYPHSWTSLSKSGVLSDTGNCKTFRNDADGYCRADYVGSIVVKRLEDAEAHNDNILAVVASSGRSHSGNSSSITTSDAGAQERLFRKVLRTARVSPLDVSYVEMHGTGTQIGDPAEMTAVSNTFKSRPNHAPLRIGGIKANIGHSEAAAGMSSLLKCIMMFQKSVIPPQAGLPHALNPRYPDLSKVNIEIPTVPMEFKRTGQKPRRILLNNFDAAGGNASILLEDYVAPPDTMEEKLLPVDPRTSHVIAISAKTKASFEMNSRNLIQWLEENETTKLQDLAYTTTARRIHHPIRRAFTVTSTQELRTKLEQDEAYAAQPQQPPVVFVFAGQGSHYGGMGKDLYATCVPFREMADLCASICNEHGFPPFLDIITNSDANVTTKEAIQTQLALATLEISLATFWISCGIQPATVTGHSLGEFVALHVAGVLSLADVLYVIGHRARLLTELCESDTCGMLAISSSSTAVQELLKTKPNTSCSIACINSPNATVISGLTDDVVEIQKGLKVPSKLLSVPYGFHSLQMDPMINDFVSLAGGITFSPPKIPVASTLRGVVVDKAGVFDASYMGQQTRQPVDFVGAIKAIKLANPVWIEIGPSAICSSFVRVTLVPSAERVMSSLEPTTDPWMSVSRVLARAYESGVSIDWFAFHGPFAADLNLLKLPSYSWDLKDYWITYQEPTEIQPTSVTAPVTPPRISSCAAYVVQKSTSPKLSVTLGASIESPEFKALIDGHKIRGVPIVPGSVFCEAGLATARYALEYGRRQLQETSRLLIRDMSLKRPLTRKLAGEDAKLHTTVEADDLSGDKFYVTWKAASKRGHYDLGSCVVIIANADVLNADWSRISFFPSARARDLVRIVKEGHGHRLQSSILYTLFTNTVEYDPAFQCIKEAFVSSTFDEATAEVILNEDPRETQFVASPYWGESLVHLAGFLVNAKPERLGAQTTLMMDSFKSFEQTVDLTPGKSYSTYVRIASKDKDTTQCDVYVHDGEEMIMQCSGLRFHEVNNDMLDRLLSKPTMVSASRSEAPRASNGAVKSHEGAQKQDSSVLKVARKEQVVAPDIAEVGQRQVIHGQEPSRSVDVFGIILNTIAKATGTKVSDLTDDTVLMDLGIDSIMGIEIAAQVNSSASIDLLPSFMMEYLTVGDLFDSFGRGEPHPSKPNAEPTSGYSVIGDTLESSVNSAAASVLNLSSPTEHDSKAHSSKQDSEKDMVIVPSSVDYGSPAPSTRVTLLQGRVSSGKQPFYLIADGTGSIATYIHLPPFKSKMPVYGIDSPYLRCPDRLATGGIEGAATYIVEALLKFQPKGPFSIGGFSGGAILGYEVCRRLAAAGRSVDRLLLIDMCCPRPIGALDKAEVGWKVYESIANQGGMWRTSSSTQQHLRNIFFSVANYHPSPLAAKERPKRVAIIWAKKGLIDRCSNDAALMALLDANNIPTKAYPGFMEDPEMGAIAWGLPHKTPEDLGPNGWDRYVGETLALTIDADHLEMPMPSHVHLLHGAMEEAFAYLDHKNE